MEPSSSCGNEIETACVFHLRLIALGRAEVVPSRIVTVSFLLVERLVHLVKKLSNTFTSPDFLTNLASRQSSEFLYSN